MDKEDLMKKLVLIFYGFINLYGHGEIVSMEKQIKEVKDTLKKEKIYFWKKLDFGIGYSGGLIWASVPLIENGPISFDIIELISRRFYWLNLIEGSVLWPKNHKQKFEFVLGYEWTHLKNRTGLHMSIPVPESDDDIDIYTPEWVIKILDLTLGRKIAKNIYFSGSFYLSEANTIEYLYPPHSDIPTKKAKVTRLGIGGGVSLKIEPSKSSSNFIFPILKIKIGKIWEVKNNAPWEWKWKEKLYVLTSGLYVGFKFQKGGTK